MAIRYTFFGTLVFILITNLFGAQPAVQTQSAVMTVPSKVALSGNRSTDASQAIKSSQNILSDTFEGSFPNQWQLFSASSTLWGQTSYRAAGGSNSVYCAGGGSTPASQGGPYFNDMQVWMIYGPFSLSDAISASVSFDLWMKTEPASGNVYNDYVFYGFSLDGSQFSGFNTAGNTQGWAPRSFGVSEITNIEVLGKTEVWFGIGFFSNPTITDEGAYIDNVSLTKTTTDPCTLSCSANVPASGLAGVPVNFTAQATANNCSSSPTYTWNFGDNSQGSTAQNTTHSYAAEGSFSWSMLASVDGQTCQKTGVISITGASANYNHEYWVPAAAHAAGNLGSQWRTDLGVFNPGSATASLRVDFHDSGTIRSLSRSLSPGSSVLLNDVIGLYNVNSSGALEILTDQEVFVTSRTYNEGNSGSFGQFLDGTDPAMALLNGQSATLPQLREDAAFRTNIGLLNTSATNAVVKVELFDGNGTSLKSFNRTLTPGLLRQENQPFSALAGRSDIVRGSAVIKVVSGSGVIAYGSVIDNQTQDPTTIPMKGGATEIRQAWVAAAAHAAGNLGSQWRTDLGLLNRQTSAALVTVRMHEGGNTYNLPVSISPGEQALLTDVVGRIGVNGSGSLEISSDVPLYITSRTYNQGSAGTFGQFLDGYSPDASIGVGQTVFLPQLSENASFRSNIGFVNTSASNASVKVQLLGTSGTVLGQFTKTLVSGESWQKNSPFSSVAGQSNISGGTAMIEVTSGSGIIAYASVIDNLTQDPTTIPMKGAGGIGGILGTVHNNNGAPLSGALVEAAGISALTNGQGFYVLESIPIAAEVSVAFSKAGHVPTVKVLRVVAGESNTQNAVLFPTEASTTISAATGGTLSTADGASITIPPNVLVDQNGQVFTGNATVTLNSFDPSIPSELDAFPGTFQGINIAGQSVFINTFGFADVTVTAGSQQLQLAPNTTATLEVPIPSTLTNGAPANIPSWWFDPDSQIWYEVGNFVNVNNKYRTGIPHFSIWNCDVAATRCYVSGRVVDINGDPVKGARVTFISYRNSGGYVNSGETSTPSDGTFRIPVDANADIEYWAEKGNVESAHAFDHACTHNGDMNVSDIVLGSGGANEIIGITLTWGDTPSDLDSHLTVPLSGGGWEHLFYRNKIAADATLDTDDTDGNGPEIFTVTRIHDGRYRYSVHHYAGSGNFASSQARVSVVGGGVSYRTYTPPSSGAVGDDDVWRVFDLDCLNEVCTVRPINDYLHNVDAGDASSFEP